MKNILIALVAFATLVPPIAGAQESVARIVSWLPTPDQKDAFETGYKRHLQWHREHRDPWAWHGWTVASGDQVGMFIDGTFFRSWSDFDSPVAPAEDAADNAKNVYPYADLRTVAAYELVQGSAWTPVNLKSPLLSAIEFEVAPGGERAFEESATQSLKTAQLPAFALFRPADGTSKYLLFLPAAKPSGLASHAPTVRGLNQAANRDAQVVRSYRMQLLRYRAELSLIPEPTK
jgi:hypothetical protein